MDLVRFLLEQRAGVHVNVDGSFQAASRYGHFEVVKSLIEKGLKLHTNGDFHFVLHPNVDA